MHRIGEDVAEALDVIPALVRVLRTIRPKYACRCCHGTLVQAAVRPRVASRYASVGSDAAYSTGNVSLRL